MSLRRILLIVSSCHLSLGDDCDSFDDWRHCYGNVEHVSVLSCSGMASVPQWKCVLPTRTVTLQFGQLDMESSRRRVFVNIMSWDLGWEKVIRVVSSDIDRTIMSAAANMAGMFPLSPERNWGGLDWYPFPVHTIPKEFDNRYEAEFLKFYNSEEYRQIQGRFKDVLDFAELMCGWEMDVRHFTHLYDSLYIESLYGLPLPRWTRDIFPDAMIELVGTEFAFATWTQPLKRLKSGFLLNTLLENIKGKLNGTLVENISVYSGHDTTLSALLNAMGVFDFLPPPFAASVLFELRRTAGSEPVITIFYKNSPESHADPVPLCLPGCTFACPLSQLEILWAPLLVHDWESECEA